MTVIAMIAKIMTMPISSMFNEISILFRQFVNYANAGIGSGQLDEPDTTGL
jgi:hypothetical protein